ncbi:MULTISPECIES: ShlB/FhaC/HecB family hemolysin secretion/activation protein [Xanthomonas]|uniref:ShlB/FhaC/HecB family hemolysin secretion/activation protein n=1 Tax=Xanthomonas TaxID=338 RepID=UPI001C46023D|nr:ShlB/FhaC/HecB family hemolysin secretion/activation protein [Xanthomonas euvesicatoria]MBV6778144.1 ShlB/FhaC/HecB family hemolysin secretion/activation protein [Xanthomonas campestris pv. carissae]MBV6805785.1 ShlB/FhaC/HecB family hemolysin secretion/activation protein [Xanthomonas campestris pv. convolvuli]
MDSGIKGRVRLRATWCAVLIAGATQQVSAQQITDPAAQELLRQQERERVLREQQEARPDVRLERAPDEGIGRLPKTEAPCFVIERIVLDGPGADDFRWALASANTQDDPATGRCLGTDGINLVMKRVQNAVIARGYVTTRVLAAPQDLTGGTLTLSLVPGRLHTARFSAPDSARAAIANAVPARPGELLNLRDIEQGLENFQRVPTVTADIQIAPAEGSGTGPGESDLAIAWQQRSRLRASLSLDDAGSDATGKLQANGTLSLDNPLGLNELFYVSLGKGVFNAAGKDTDSWTVHYDIPYGYWLFGATASSYDYSQAVAGAIETYDYSGRSRNAEARIDRLLFRNAAIKVGAYGRGWWRQSASAIDDTEIEVQRRRTAGWELGLNHRQFFGKVTFDASLAYRRGTGAFDALRAPEELAHAFDPSIPLEGTSRIKLIVADAQVVVPFQIGNQRLRYSASWRAQWNRTPMAPQDRFAIGGRFTVRGFDGEATLSGDRGWSLRNDLGLAIGGGLEAYLGADYGHIGGQSTRFQAGDHLAGISLGLRGGWQHFSMDTFLGSALEKPANFPTDYTTFGFSLSWRY